MRQFALTEQHIALLRRMNVTWSEGAPCIDPKRPYGNSTVLDDLAELLGLADTRCPLGVRNDLGIEPSHPNCCERYVSEQDEAVLWRLHRETETALAVFLRLGHLEPGDFEAHDHCQNWRPCNR